MTGYELLTVSVSAVALGIALVTLYLSYFYKRAGFTAILLTRHYDDVHGKCDNALEYCVGNTGNQILILRDVMLIIGYAKGRPSAGPIMRPHTECLGLPLLLKPGNVKLINLRIAAKALAQARQAHQPCHVCFSLVTPLGTKYDLLHDVTALDEHNTEGHNLVWEPIRLSPKDTSIF